MGTSSSSDGVRVLSTSPGFWLEDSSGGGSSINFVNDGGYFQIQERSTGFEGFLKNLMYIQVSSGNTCIYGNLTSGATCDFVFGQDHKVPTIEEVDKNIKQYNKLPGLEEPEGISMRDLMIKTEEQALYIIQLNNKLKDLEKQFVLFSARLAALEKKE
ncbi:MAG: hypothetical protein GY841_22060 [FCB group bacterium]|nr:hypothetical protein [FCB group bacterium]